MPLPTIAVDASAGLSGGGRKYIENLLPRLLASGGVRVGPVLVRPGMWPEDDARFNVIAVPGRLGARSARWRDAVASSGANLVYAPTEISFSRYAVPVVLAARNALILDRALWKDLEPAQRRLLRLRRVLARRSAAGAAGFVAVSKYAAAALADGLGVSPSSVQVVYHGGSDIEYTPRPRPIRNVLFVSSIHRYKGLDVLLRALARLDYPWTLHVAGDRADEKYSREIDAIVRGAGLTDRVRFRGFAKGDLLRRMYREADLFVWPSRAETFGHPLLEAHSSGLPIVSARACSNEEIAGNAAHYFEPADVDGLTALLGRAFSEGLGRGSLPRNYDWDATAMETARFLAAVSQGHGGA